MTKFGLNNRAFKAKTPKWVKVLAKVWYTFGIGGGSYLVSDLAQTVTLFGREWNSSEQLLAHTILSVAVALILECFYEDSDDTPSTTAHVEL